MSKMLRTLPVLGLALCAVATLGDEIANRVVRFDPTGANLLRADRWQKYEAGFERSGEVLACLNTAAGQRRGAVQTVILNQSEPAPILATAWSKAEGVAGTKDSDYALYLDLIYADGDHLWGQAGAFSVGTHDWERAEVRVLPQKPVRSLSLYLLLREHAGKAMFKDAALHVLPLSKGVAMFDGVSVADAALGREGFCVRDAAADSDFVAIDREPALGVTLQWHAEPRGGATFYRGTLTDATGKDRAITLVYRRALPAGAWTWLADVRREEATQPPRDYSHVGGQQRVSPFPFAAVVPARTQERGQPRAGRAIALDLMQPACFRVGFASASNELYIAMDLGLAPERSAAEFSFCLFDFDAAWGARAAVQALHEACAEAFRCRTPQQGIWMPFAKISRVRGWEDFGFKFKEGNDETAWDNAHGILTFRYTEPMTWWMTMPPQMPRTLEAAVAEAKRRAEKGDRQALALLSSGFHDPAGSLVARMEDTPWCNGAVWSINSAPFVRGDVTDFKTKWGPAVREPLYGPQRKADLAGEYVDSSEGYVTALYDFRRDHFTAGRAPLTFDPETHRVAVYRGLIAYDYVRALAEDLHPSGKLTMANGTPSVLCWLAPWLDVLGTETDWNRSNHWRPMTDRDLLYRRMLCGPKPYCFLMNTRFENWSRAMTEKFMQRCLAYGMFPGFFSHNASQDAYFTRPELYERDRELFKRYVPLCKRVAEAGWQPIPLARSSDPLVHVERFGKKYLTVFNDSPEQKTVTIRLDGIVAKGATSLLDAAQVAIDAGHVQVTLEAEDVAVLELKDGP